MSSDGLALTELSLDKFLERYKLTNYPVDRAASHYLHAAQSLECTVSARKQLELLKSPGAAEALEPAAARKLLEKVSVIDLNGVVISPVISSAESPEPGNLEQESQMATTTKAAKKPTANKAAEKPAAKKVAEKKPVEKKPAWAEPKARKPGVGGLIIQGLLDGKDTEEILMDVREQFPESKAVSTTVSWYRGKLRKEGKLKG